MYMHVICDDVSGQLMCIRSVHFLQYVVISFLWQCTNYAPSCSFNGQDPYNVEVMIKAVFTSFFGMLSGDWLRVH